MKRTIAPMKHYVCWDRGIVMEVADELAREGRADLAGVLRHAASVHRGTYFHVEFETAADKDVVQASYSRMRARIGEPGPSLFSS